MLVSRSASLHAINIEDRFIEHAGRRPFNKFSFPPLRHSRV